jgi:hypothetical protein
VTLLRILIALVGPAHHVLTLLRMMNMDRQVVMTRHAIPVQIRPVTEAAVAIVEAAVAINEN